MGTLDLVLETVDRMLVDHCDKAVLDAAEAGTFAKELWGVLDDNGLTQLGREDSGTTLSDAYRVLERAARYVMPVPLGEHVLAHQLLRGLDEPPVGIVTLALGEAGSSVEAPWARDADWIVIAAQGDGGARMRLVAAGDCSIAARTNMAGEPRDEVMVDDTMGRPIDTDSTLDAVRERLALLRVMQMAGALARTLELALEYAQERVQFGRPISKFQAIQHQLAVLAAESAAASRAADAALEHLADERFPVLVAAAKARVGEAAGIGAEIAHQVHGAMGFTHEHQLHHFTRRLWAWRDEHGTEAYWQGRLGRAVAAGGADFAWDFITRH